MDAKLDANGDLDLSTGDIQILTGIAAAQQRITRRLKTFLGEVFTDSRIGMPWFQSIFKKPARIVLAKSLIRQMILTDPEVDEVLDLVVSFNGPTRALSISRLVAIYKTGDPIILTDLPIVG